MHFAFGHFRDHDFVAKGLRAYGFDGFHLQTGARKLVRKLVRGYVVYFDELIQPT